MRLAAAVRARLGASKIARIERRVFADHGRLRQQSDPEDGTVLWVAVDPKRVQSVRHLKTTCQQYSFDAHDWENTLAKKTYDGGGKF